MRAPWPTAHYRPMTADERPQYEHAIVLGASMAGLATAQALANHFQHVTIVEHDHLPDSATARSGVPQSRHVHVMLPGGEKALEQLFPGFGGGLLAIGATSVRVPQDMLWMNAAGWVSRFAGRRRMLAASRDLIEWYTRLRIQASERITVLDGRHVQGLVPSPSGRAVAGIELRSVSHDRGGARAEDATRLLSADLVVDATGRRSRTPDWLTRMGYDRPQETRIDAGLSYATRIYRRPDAGPGWKAIFLQPRPPETNRMGVVAPIEDDRWMVTLQGAGGDQPPTDEEGFLAFARAMRTPAIHEAIRNAEPLTPIVGFANTANRRRHYDKLRRWPERLVVVGDSACVFNPVYGQGMTVAAQTAVALDQRLSEHGLSHRSLDGFAAAMQRRVAKVGDAAWMIATGDDLRYPSTTGAKAGRSTRMMHRYLDRIHAAATTDEAVLNAFSDAFFLLRPPSSLFHPRVVARTLTRRTKTDPEPAAMATGASQIATVPR